MRKRVPELPVLPSQCRLNGGCGGKGWRQSQQERTSWNNVNRSDKRGVWELKRTEVMWGKMHVKMAGKRNVWGGWALVKGKGPCERGVKTNESAVKKCCIPTRKRASTAVSKGRELKAYRCNGKWMQKGLQEQWNKNQDSGKKGRDHGGKEKRHRKTPNAEALRQERWREGEFRG